MVDLRDTTLRLSARLRALRDQRRRVRDPQVCDLAQHLGDGSGRQHSTILLSAMRKLLTRIRPTLRRTGGWPITEARCIPQAQGKARRKLGLVDACLRPIRRIRQWPVTVDEVCMKIQVECRQTPLVNRALINSSAIPLFASDGHVFASDGHAAMISRPPPRHHWFTDPMTSERRTSSGWLPPSPALFCGGGGAYGVGTLVLLQPDQQSDPVDRLPDLE